MPENKEELHHDENTLRKVYEGLLAAGIFGQQAVDAVNQMQNQGILFRENKPKRRGRPPKTVTDERQKEIEADLKSGEQSPFSVVLTKDETKQEDPWSPPGDADVTITGS